MDSPAPGGSTTTKKKAPKPSLRKVACVPCRKRHIGCDRTFPCSRCVKLGLQCKDPRKSDDDQEEEEPVPLHMAMFQGRAADLVRLERKYNDDNVPKHESRPMLAAKIKRFMRSMERMMSSERDNIQKCKKIEDILNALTLSLHNLCIDNYEDRMPSCANGTTELAISSAIASSSPSTPISISISYRHGDPATAMHNALADLFGYPFASMCYVAIDGIPVSYVNPYFEQIFLSGEEVNTRMKIGIPPPEIFASLVAPCDRPWVSRMLDSCLFFCPDTICETSQVLKFCANDKEIMGYLRTRIVLDVDGYYMGAIFAVQPIPVVMEVFRNISLLRPSDLTVVAHSKTGRLEGKDFFQQTLLPSPAVSSSVRVKRQKSTPEDLPAAGGSLAAPSVPAPQYIKQEYHGNPTAPRLALPPPPHVHSISPSPITTTEDSSSSSASSPCPAPFQDCDDNYITSPLPDFSSHQVQQPLGLEPYGQGHCLPPSSSQVAPTPSHSAPPPRQQHLEHDEDELTKLYHQLPASVKSHQVDGGPYPHSIGYGVAAGQGDLTGGLPGGRPGWQQPPPPPSMLPPAVPQVVPAAPSYHPAWHHGYVNAQPHQCSPPYPTSNSSGRMVFAPAPPPPMDPSIVVGMAPMMATSVAHDVWYEDQRRYYSQNRSSDRMYSNNGTYYR